MESDFQDMSVYFNSGYEVSLCNQHNEIKRIITQRQMKLHFVILDFALSKTILIY